MSDVLLCKHVHQVFCKRLRLWQLRSDYLLSFRLRDSLTSRVYGLFSSLLFQLLDRIDDLVVQLSLIV
jgi:hypothetical protein